MDVELGRKEDEKWTRHLGDALELLVVVLDELAVDADQTREHQPDALHRLLEEGRAALQRI